MYQVEKYTVSVLNGQPQPLVLRPPFANLTGSFRVTNNSQYIAIISGFNNSPNALDVEPGMMDAINYNSNTLPITISFENTAASDNTGYVPTIVVAWSDQVNGFGGNYPTAIHNPTITNISGQDVTATIASGTVDIGNTPTVTIDTSGGAIPVTATGTVDIGNTPSVVIDTSQAPVSVEATGTVDIGNTPTVNIAANQVVQVEPGSEPLTIAGTVDIGGTPSVSIVSGTVDATISGDVTVEAFPSSQASPSTTMVVSPTSPFSISLPSNQFTYIGPDLTVDSPAVFDEGWVILTNLNVTPSSSWTARLTNVSVVISGTKVFYYPSATQVNGVVSPYNCVTFGPFPLPHIPLTTMAFTINVGANAIDLTGDITGLFHYHTVTGSLDVNVTNSTLDIDGSVSIGNTPTVNIASGQTVAVTNESGGSLTVAGTVDLGNTANVTIDTSGGPVDISGNVSNASTGALITTSSTEVILQPTVISANTTLTLQLASWMNNLVIYANSANSTAQFSTMLVQLTNPDTGSGATTWFSGVLSNIRQMVSFPIIPQLGRLVTANEATLYEFDLGITYYVPSGGTQANAYITIIASDHPIQVPVIGLRTVYVENDTSQTLATVLGNNGTNQYEIMNMQLQIYNGGSSGGTVHCNGEWAQIDGTTNFEPYIAFNSSSNTGVLPIVYRDYSTGDNGILMGIGDTVNLWCGADNTVTGLYVTYRQLS